MADPRAVETKRQQAEARLRQQIAPLAEKLGIPFRWPSVPHDRFPQLYAMELTEELASFLQRVNEATPARAPA